MNYKQTADRAYELHTQNKFEEAEQLYIELLNVSPDDANILNLYGLLCLSKGNFDKAISLLSRAVVLKESSYIMANLAKAYLYNNEIKNAIKLFESASELEPNDDIYYSLAIAYKKINNIDKAVKSYEKALNCNPSNYNAAYNLSLLYTGLNKIKKAINAAERCLFIKPGSEEVFSLLSSLYESDGNIQKAISSLENASLLNKKEYLYYYNLGVLYSKINCIDKSIYNYKKVLELCPNNVETLVNLCSIYKSTNKDIALSYILQAYKISPCDKNVLLNLAQIYKDLFKNDESISILIVMLKLYPESSEANSLLAINYMDKGEYNLALDYYNKALELNPDNLNYLHGKATAMKYLNKIEESKKILEYIVSKDSSLIQSATSLGMIYLQEKNFHKGMELYSKRSLDTNFAKLFKEKVWNINTKLINKTVLVYSDCGLGDSIMFARYIKPLSAIADAVFIQTDSELVSIFKNTFNNVKIFSKSEKRPDYDVVIPFMNLPWALNMDFDNIPSCDSYITPDSNLVNEYSKLDVFNTNKIKVGIVASGNKRIFKNRILPAQYIKEFLSEKNIKLYSFQKENINYDNIIQLSMMLTDYNVTAALLKNIDLLITIDSSIVHMAGALGVKTYLLLPFTAEWRWFNDNKTTPWYNSVSIFRQTETGNWNSVIQNVLKEINKNEY